MKPQANIASPQSNGAMMDKVPDRDGKDRRASPLSDSSAKGADGSDSVFCLTTQGLEQKWKNSITAERQDERWEVNLH